MEFRNNYNSSKMLYLHTIAIVCNVIFPLSKNRSTPACVYYLPLLGAHSFLSTICFQRFMQRNVSSYLQRHKSAAAVSHSVRCWSHPPDVLLQCSRLYFDYPNEVISDRKASASRAKLCKHSLSLAGCG